MQSSSQRALEIEVYSDLACPWCYVGKKKLDRAIKESGIQAVVVWRAFLLDPEFMYSQPLDDYLRRRFNVTDIEPLKNRLVAAGKDVGAAFTNWKYRAATLGGHRLIALARRHGKSDVASDILFTKYYEEGEDIADVSVLLEIAKQLNLHLTEEELAHFLSSSDKEGLLEDVLEDDTTAKKRYRVHGVPAFFIGPADAKAFLSGAQPVDVFKEALLKATAGGA